ncbi:MAG: acyl-CoA dehydrogenase family protein [Rhizobiales bacterium]|jgi:acyl-CoA dehydrogenase|nr:acyl-CoA dehydrogenase family protein [Hyphomicrobiales bacterium]
MAGAANPIDFDHRYQGPLYKPEHQAWRATLRKFVDTEIMPYVDEWEEAGEFPRDLYRKAAAIGLLGLRYPEEYGGTPVNDPIYSIVTAEELARTGAGGINASLMVHGIGLPPVLAIGSKEMKARVAPQVLAGEKIHALCITEPSGGSDVANLKTRAHRDGDHFVVNGSKMFITGGMRADYYTVAVRTGGEGRKGVSLLLLERDMPGFTRTPLKKQGWWSSDTAALYFDDVRVPVENLIGEENKGFIGIMLNFNNERIGLASSANAYARVCFEDALAWARERRTFGQRLADHQVIRHKFAEMARMIAATQAYLEQCVVRVQDGETPVADLSLLKVQATLTMEYCAREAMQIMGGAGYMRGSRVERLYREVRVNAIGGGSEEIMRDLAARQLGI